MSVSTEAGPFTRSCSSTPIFDWKTDCLFAVRNTILRKRSSWSLVEVVADKAQGSQDMYTRVMKAAEQRKDIEMLTRLCGVAIGDLVAMEARYCRQKGCYSHYISKVKIKVARFIVSLRNSSVRPEKQ